MPVGLVRKHKFSRGTGLLQQARQQVEVAAAPCNRLRGRPPALVFHFPLGCGPDVRQELQQLGIIVTGTPFPPPLHHTPVRVFLYI